MNIIGKREREGERGRKGDRNNLVAVEEVIIIASQLFDLTLSGGVRVNLHKRYKKKTRD